MGLITLSVEGISGDTGKADDFVPSVCSMIRLPLRDQCLKERDKQNPENFAIFSNVFK